jgi:hypothetical protein
LFADILDKLPSNFSPKRSPDDSTYFGKDCLAAARQHGSTPLHAIKIDARHIARTETFYQKCVNFADYWSRRFAALYMKRVHSETVFSMISALFGHRLRCHASNGRKNEVRDKLALLNLIQLAMRKGVWS